MADIQASLPYEPEKNFATNAAQSELKDSTMIHDQEIDELKKKYNELKEMHSKMGLLNSASSID